MYRSSLSLPITMSMAGLLATSQQSIPSGSITVVTFQTTLYNTIGASLTPVVATNRITVNKEGIYEIVGSSSFQAGTSGRRWVSVRINASQDGRVEFGNPDVAWTANSATQVHLNAGDYVDLVTYQNSGSAILTQINASPPFLSVQRVA